MFRLLLSDEEELKRRRGRPLIGEVELRGNEGMFGVSRLSCARKKDALSQSEASWC